MVIALAGRLALSCMCLYFLTALLTGAWKYMHMRRPPTFQAPPYVDIAHRASLQYSFACLVLAALVQFSALGTTINVAAVSAVLLFFTIVIASYIGLGISNHTDNQFRVRSFSTTIGVYLLIIFEIGGFVVIAAGALKTLWF